MAKLKILIGLVLTVCFCCFPLMAGCETVRPVPLSPPAELAYDDNTDAVSFAADQRASGLFIRVTGQGVTSPMTEFAFITPEQSGFGVVQLRGMEPALELRNGALKIEVYFKGDGAMYSDSAIAVLHAENTEKSALHAVNLYVSMTDVYFSPVPSATGYRFRVTGAGTVVPMADFLPVALPESSDGRVWLHFSLEEVPGLAFKRGPIEITVVAEDDTGEFLASESTLTLSEEPIYSTLPHTETFFQAATVGEYYSASAALPVAPWNLTEIPYSYTLLPGTVTPLGLTLSPDGTVSGTPEKSVKRAAFTVVARAQGFSERQVLVYLHVREEIKVVSDGIFEAEYADIITSTGGWSYLLEAEEFIAPASNVSKGLFINMWKTSGRCRLEFVIASSRKVADAGLKLALGSAIGSKILTPDIFEIFVNDVRLEYESIKLPEGTQYEIFQEFLISTNNLNLIKGDNVISVEMKDNALWAPPDKTPSFGAPGVDYIKIEDFGEAVLLWRPCTYNLDWFEQVA